MTISAPDDPEPGEPPSDGDRKRKLLFVVTGSVLVTGALLALVFSLGSWAYRYRHGTLHHGRLSRLVAQRPSEDRVTRALLDEGARPLPTPGTEAELRALAAGLPAARADDLVARARTWPMLRVFAVQGMVYVLFFDGEGQLRDYVVLEGRPGP